MVLGVDEQDSEHHAVLADADDLAGLPVVVADLHSALPAVLAGLRDADPGLRVAYVMTDGGALPIDFSRTVAGLREAGWLAASITVGQAFGGDLEAVNVHTGLLAARHVVGADVASWPRDRATSAPARAGASPARRPARRSTPRATLGGRPVASLRVSEADPRERHRGRLPPQPDGIRPGRARPGRRAGPPAAAGARRATCSSQARALCGRERPARSGLDEVADATVSTRPLRDDAGAAVARWAADTTTTAPASSARPSRGGMPPGCCSLVADRLEGGGPVGSGAQRTSSRSTTKISVSPGSMAAPAPRSP